VAIIEIAGEIAAGIAARAAPDSFRCTKSIEERPHGRLNFRYRHPVACVCGLQAARRDTVIHAENTDRE
jgi:hypothetical protein